jgi:hypothetical protein
MRANLIFIAALWFAQAIWLVVQANDSYDGYAYEYQDEYKYEVSRDGGEEVPLGTESMTKTTEPTSMPSNQREKERKEERRRESLKMQQQLKEKQRKMKEEEDEKAAALAAKEAADQERSEFVRTGGGVGYKKNVGRGLKKVITPLANDQYLKSLALNYMCVPFDSWGVVKQNKTKELEEEAKIKEAEMKDQLSRLDGTFTADKKETEEQKHPEKVYDNPKVKAKPKKPTFRELQEKKMQERKEKEEKKLAAIGSFPLGSSCEGLACASCRSLVEEFGDAVVSGASNPAFTYIEDVLPALCSRKEVKQRYSDLVGGMCDTIVTTRLGYKEAFVAPFEEDEQWTSASMVEKLPERTKKVCTDLGACEKKHFEVRLSSNNAQEKHWDDRCFVCQAFATELEERLQLRRATSEGDTDSVARTVCGKLALPTNLRPICEELSPGRYHSDVAWLAYMHAESIPRQKKASRLFKDQICEELKFCQPYVDEEEAAMQEAKKVEPVFF